MDSGDLVLSRRITIGFLLVVLAVFVYVVWTSQSFPQLARFMPMYVGVIGIFTVGVEIVLELFGRRRVVRDEDVQLVDLPGDLGLPLAEVIRKGGKYFLWIIAYFAAIFVLGMYPGTAVYIVAFMRFEARATWLATIVSTLSTLALTAIAGQALNLHWPRVIWAWFG